MLCKKTSNCGLRPSNMSAYSSAPLETFFCCGITVNDFGIFDRIDEAELSIGVMLLLLLSCSAHCHIVDGVVVTWFVVRNNASSDETFD